MAARVYGIERQSLWFDEGWSAFAAAQPSVIAAANADATNPPLYYALLHISTYFLGDSEFALRLFSTFCGLLAVALTFALGRRLFSARAGIYAALLAACSPLLWWASQEARMYTLLAVLVLVCALAWHRLYTRPARGTWLALCGAELALLYAHNTGPVVVLWLNLATVIAWIAARRFDRPFSWKHWLAGQVVVGLLWAPYFFTRFLNLSGANEAVTSTTPLNVDMLLAIWRGFWQTPWERVLLSPESPLPYVALLVVALALIAWRKAASRWLVLHVVLLVGGLIAALLVLGNDLHGRYLVMVMPLLLAALGGGIARLRPPIVRVGAAAIFVALFAYNLVTAQDSVYRHDDARAMVQYYDETLNADDTVLAWSYADRYELAYYWDRLGVQARRVTLPEGGDLDAVLPLLPSGGDVALNVWYTQRADYRRMMECLLGNGTVTEPETFTTYGMSSLLYRQPTLRLPELTPTSMEFSDASAPLARLTAYRQPDAVPGSQAQCIPLELTLLRDVDVNFKAALIVQNGLGWEIARADAAFATANQRESAALAPGETLTAYPLLRLPYGAGSGAYRVYLRLYDEVVNPSGYQPPAGVPVSGRDVLLGTWDAAEAGWTPDDSRIDLPHRASIAAGDALTLVTYDSATGTTDAPASVVNGSEIRLTLLWYGQGELAPLTLADTDGRWSLEIPPSRDETQDAVTLDWRAVRIPASAGAGTAELRLPDGTVLARYTVDVLPLVLEPPAVDHAVGEAFPGVGTLVGYRLSEPLSLDVPPMLTLVWQGDSAPSEVSYTVFAQLLNAEGRVIAQSDSIPATNTRPTTGWRSGEYIEDAHTLTYNALAASGDVTLIVGMYNAADGQRVRLADGRDFVTLAEGVPLQP